MPEGGVCPVGILGTTTLIVTFPTSSVIRVTLVNHFGSGDSLGVTSTFNSGTFSVSSTGAFKDVKLKNSKMEHQLLSLRCFYFMEQIRILKISNI